MIIAIRSSVMLISLMSYCFSSDAVTVSANLEPQLYEDDPIAMSWKFCNYFPEPVKLMLTSAVEFDESELNFSESLDGNINPIIFYRPNKNHSTIGLFPAFHHLPFKTNESIEIPLFLSQYTLKVPQGHHHIIWKGRIKIAYAEASLHEWIETSGSLNIEILAGNRPNSTAICERQYMEYRSAVNHVIDMGGDVPSDLECLMKLRRLFSGRYSSLIPYAKRLMEQIDFITYDPIIDFLDRMRHHPDAKKLLEEVWSSGKYEEIDQFLEREIEKDELIGNADIIVMLRNADIRIQRVASAYILVIVSRLDADRKKKFTQDHAEITGIMTGNVQSSDAFLSENCKKFFNLLNPAVRDPQSPPDPIPIPPNPGAQRYFPQPPVGRPDPSGNGF